MKRSAIFRYSPLLAGLALLFVAVGCARTIGNSASPPPPDTRPVVDQAPYWCEFVPQEAFRRITSSSAPLREHATGAWRTNGQCRIETADHSQLLTTLWSASSDSKKMLDDAYLSWRKSDPSPLPRELGSGFAALPRVIPGNTQPYYVISSFYCGGVNPWISLELGSVTRDRNPIHDLIELMRIAQKRYGQLFSCTPGRKPS
jgi:hypothetical protein